MQPQIDDGSQDGTTGTGDGGRVGIGEKTPSDLECCQPQVPVLAELLCSEPSPLEEVLLSSGVNKRDDGDSDGERRAAESTTSVQSHFDPVILHHMDVMSRLKTLESRMEKPCDYLRSSSSSGSSASKDEILPYMRKIVASWMLEVCEEQRCSEIIFPLAVALLDKFLGTCTVKKDQLQLVASVCLLLSSKSRQCNYFSLELLSWYTDNSVTPQALRTWELVVLSHLNWDINVLTPTDFVDFLLARCPGLENQIPNENQLLRRHAITFMALCSTEPRFVGLKPSLIAASSIYTALNGLRLNRKELGTSLASLAEVTIEQLHSISTSIDLVISTEIAAIEQQSIDLPMVKQTSFGSTSPTITSTSTSSCSSRSSDTSSVPSSSSSCSASTTSSRKLSCGQFTKYGQNTPTDVQDIAV